MKKVEFNAFCPYEVGDKINMKCGSRSQVRTITDIACSHYIQSDKVEFTYELDGDGIYLREQDIQDEAERWAEAMKIELSIEGLNNLKEILGDITGSWSKKEREEFLSAYRSCLSTGILALQEQVKKAKA